MKDIIVRKGVTGFILCVLVGVAAIPSTNTIDSGSPLRYEQGGMTECMSYKFSFIPPSVGTTETADATFLEIDMPGCIGLGRQPGDPILPVKFIQLLLPPQEAVDSVTVTGSPVELRSSGKDLTKERVYPSQEEVPVGSATPSEFVMNEEVYSSHELYPAVSYGEYHIGYSHGYAILDMALQPVQLIPAEGRLFYYPEMTITISLQKTGSVNPFFRGTPEDETWVKSLVSNPEVAVRFVDLPTLEYPGGLCDPADNYDYVIITTTQNGLDYWDTSGSTPYNWESLMQRHMSDGLLCTLVTVQDINACSDYWNTSSSLFNDSQAHIREFCRDAYEDWETQYVLVAGDSNTIPARQLYYEYEGNVDSDLYWSNLDNTFNADHDNQWGEEGDNGFDAYSELFLGRVPCDVPQDVSNWLTKSFYYVNSSDADYLENCGFYAYGMGFPGYTESDDMIDFAAIKGTDNWLGPDPEQYPGWLGFLFGFETWNDNNPDNGFNLSVRWTNCDPNPGWQYGEPIAEFRDAINDDTVTLITGIGHADSEMVLDVFKSDWESMYHNTKPFFMIDLGCHSGDFDSSDDGVLDSMLFHSDTTLAFGCLFATGYSWGSAYDTNSSDALQTKLFWDYFLDLANNSQNIFHWQLGKGLAWSKDIMAPTLNWTYSSSPGSWRGTIEGRLLFADPAQRLRSPRDVNLPPYFTTMKWSPDTGLTLSATDPEGEDVLYMIDWGDGTITQWLGPYPSGMEETFTHTWSAPGDYSIRARAKDIWNAVSEWSDPLLVHIPNASLNITIHGGLGITVKIKNIGDENLTNVTCNIGLSGFILVGKSTTSGTDILPAMKTMTIFSLIVGFGRTTISVNATCVEGATAEKTAKGFVLGIFVLGLK